MRIAVIVNYFPKITETFVINQINGLVERGHDVTIIAMHKTGEDAGEGQIDISKYQLLQKTIFLDIVPKKYIDRIGFIVKCLYRSPQAIGIVIRSLNVFKYKRYSTSLYLAVIGMKLQKYPSFDIIHCQFGTLAPVIQKLKEVGAVKGKLVVSFRGMDITKKSDQYKNMSNGLFPSIELFLPVCAYFKDVLIHYGCEENKIKVLHSGIEVDKFVYRKRHAWNNPVRLISVGRLVAKKGFEYSIRAIREVLQTGLPVTYQIVGDGPEYNRLYDLISELSLHNYVKLLGWKDHDAVVNLINQSDILIAPSISSDDKDKEGIPNVLKEAMALGLPVISTYHSGIPELIKDGVSGTLVPERDSNELAYQIINIIKNPQSARNMCEEARRKVELEFNIRQQTDRLEYLYKTLLNN